jgi:ABC-type transport system involved in Fe-S cluster assembly fused permease/ATPase subunit
MNNPKINKAIKSLNIWMFFITILGIGIISLILFYVKDEKFSRGEIISLMLVVWGWIAVLAVFTNAKKAIKLLVKELEDKDKPKNSNPNEAASCNPAPQDT